MGEIDGAFRSWGIPRGGTGGISEAIASAAREAGREIRTEAPVARIVHGDGRATGVVLESGEEIDGRGGRLSVDANLTFLEPARAGHARARVRGARSAASGSAAARARSTWPSTGCPTSPACPGPASTCAARSASRPSVDYMEQAYDDAKYGHFSRRPYIDIVIPTLVDPSMAPPGKHTMSCFVQYAPYQLAERRRLGRRAARGLRRHGDRHDRRVRAQHPRRHPAPPGPHAARHRARRWA